MAVSAPSTPAKTPKNPKASAQVSTPASVQGGQGTSNELNPESLFPVARLKRIASTAVDDGTIISSEAVAALSTATLLFEQYLCTAPLSNEGKFTYADIANFVTANQKIEWLRDYIPKPLTADEAIAANREAKLPVPEDWETLRKSAPDADARANQGGHLEHDDTPKKKANNKRKSGGKNGDSDAGTKRKRGAEDASGSSKKKKKADGEEKPTSAKKPKKSKVVDEELNDNETEDENE